MHPHVSDSMLRAAVVELEQHVGAGGWGQPTRLFALVASDEIIAREPSLATELNLQPGTLTPVEQDGFDANAPLDDVLARIEWPDTVVGAAVTMERLVLPPTAEATLPSDTDDEALAAAAATHPDRQDVRMVVAVTRSGLEDAVLRVSSAPAEILLARPGERLVPQVSESLLATFY